MEIGLSMALQLIQRFLMTRLCKKYTLKVYTPVGHRILNIVDLIKSLDGVKLPVPKAISYLKLVMVVAKSDSKGDNSYS